MQFPDKEKSSPGHKDLTAWHALKSYNDCRRRRHQRKAKQGIVWEMCVIWLDAPQAANELMWTVVSVSWVKSIQFKFNSITIWARKWYRIIWIRNWFLLFWIFLPFLPSTGGNYCQKHTEYRPIKSKYVWRFDSIRWANSLHTKQMEVFHFPTWNSQGLGYFKWQVFIVRLLC